MSRPWLEKRGETWEVNPQGAGVRINIGGMARSVEINKLYGPLAAHLIRVRLELATTEWVVERQSLDGDNWIEMARWDCQLGFEDLEDDGA